MSKVNLPNPEQRVMVTGLYAGIFSSHVCVVPDASDEEILKACNDSDNEIIAGSGCWDIVIRTEADARKANVNFSDGQPGPCQDCPPRIHYVVRSTRHACDKKCIKDSLNVFWTLRKVRRFQKAIQENKKIGTNTFEFEGRAYFTPYAVYLAKYLEQELKPK